MLILVLIILLLLSLVIVGFVKTMLIIFCGLIIMAIIGVHFSKDTNSDNNVSDEDLGYCNRSFNKWR